jgi:hypothetical protein
MVPGSYADPEPLWLGAPPSLLARLFKPLTKSSTTEGPTPCCGPQSSSYPHPCQAGRTSRRGPGVVTPATSPTPQDLPRRHRRPGRRKDRRRPSGRRESAELDVSKPESGAKSYPTPLTPSDLTKSPQALRRVMNKIDSRSKTVREMFDRAKYFCTGGRSPKPHCGPTLRAGAVDRDVILHAHDL